MENKILITVFVPMIEQRFDMFIPINKNLYKVATSIEKEIFDVTSQPYPITDKTIISNKETGTIYNINAFINETDIKNGTQIIML